MCYTYDKSKGGDTRELQSRMVPPQKKLGRVTLMVMWLAGGENGRKAKNCRVLRRVLALMLVYPCKNLCCKCNFSCLLMRSYWFCCRSAIRSDPKYRYRKNSFLRIKKYQATVFWTCHVFKFQNRNIKLDWIFGCEVKPWIRSNNFGSLARTLDLRNKNFGSNWKKLGSRGK